MHDLPDTDDADASAERFWPEGYKSIIRTGLNRSFIALVMDEQAFKTVYKSLYRDRFDTYENFVKRLAGMVVIGAENGIDCFLEKVYDAFRGHVLLPERRYYAKYFWPQAFAKNLERELGEKAFEEFNNHHAYVHIYEEHFKGDLSFNEFITRIADLVVNGAVNGADDTLGKIYVSFLDRAPLPTVRRRPRRLR